MSDARDMLRDCSLLVDGLLAERDRYREALQHIARGDITSALSFSPARDFAAHVLNGDSVKQAHRKAVPGE